MVIPQGSVEGSLIFMFFTIFLPEHLAEFHITMFTNNIAGSKIEELLAIVSKIIGLFKFWCK